MRLPKEERHFAVTLLIAVAGGMAALALLMALLQGGVWPNAWRLLVGVPSVPLAVLLFWLVYKRLSALRRPDGPRTSEFPFTILLVMAGALPAAVSIFLLSLGVLGALGDGDIERTISGYFLVIGLGFAVPSVLLFWCAWMRRPTRAR
ncbi:MAG: hypothetical protein OXL97_10525 [Chloroflexota bacterium]|nr:hypothetical protein [Chloroflexota bacterium]MDE2886158.1 hypothetical protein [Chloroflexota bacterium]